MSTTRRRFMQTTLASGAAGLLPAPLAAQTPRTVTLSITPSIFPGLFEDLVAKLTAEGAVFMTMEDAAAESRQRLFPQV